MYGYGKLPCSLPLAASFPLPTFPSLAPSLSPVPAHAPVLESSCIPFSLVPSSTGRFPARATPESSTSTLPKPQFPTIVYVWATHQLHLMLIHICILKTPSSQSCMYLKEQQIIV